MSASLGLLPEPHHNRQRPLPDNGLASREADGGGLLNRIRLSELTLDLANHIPSLSDFKRNTVELLDRFRETGHPLVLTVNDTPTISVQSLGSALPT